MKPSIRRARVCHERAIHVPLHGMTLPWHAMASRHGAQPFEKQQKRVSNTKQSPKSVFSSQKQRLTLFCSLLRGVWKKYEVRRAEWTPGGPKPEGMDLQGSCKRNGALRRDVLLKPPLQGVARAAHRGL